MSTARPASANNTPRVAIIGGGIAGLAAAHRLRELAPQVHASLFEAGPRLGGVLSTVVQDGFQVEQSADNFITTVPWGLACASGWALASDLCKPIPPIDARTWSATAACTGCPKGS